MYRTRYGRAQDRRNTRHATLIILGTILIVIAAVVWGFPLLSQLAGFFGDLNSSDQAIDRQDKIPPASPSLSLPYEATNSATQSISGFAEAGASVFLTQNNDSIGNVVADDSGSFLFADIQLEDGVNIFSAVAIDQAGNKSLASSNLRVILSKQAPKLEISTPADRQQVSGNPRIDVKGQTDPGVRLSLNERTIIVNSSGSFSTTYNLNTGDNTLVFTASDRAGNQTRTELIVTHTP